MYLVAIAWMYVVLMMTVAEAMSPQGTIIGAVITFLLYGVLPLALLLYILGTPGRRRARLQAEAAEAAEAASLLAAGAAAASVAAAPDGGGEPAGAAVSAEREKP